MFRKRKVPTDLRRRSEPVAESAAKNERLMRLDFKMMLRGNVIDRPEGKVRQIGITVDGSTKVVTSGDLIDLKTYNALLDAGAIQPTAPKRAEPEQ